MQNLMDRIFMEPFYLCLSFAGKYIPAIGYEINERNKIEAFQINLQVGGNHSLVMFELLLKMVFERVWRWAMLCRIRTIC